MPPLNEGRRCTATSSSTGTRCRAYAIKGGTVCRMHGGSAPQVKAKASRNVAEQKAAEAVNRFALPRNVPPAQALLEAIQVAAGALVFIQSKVSELSDEEVAGMLTSRQSESIGDDGVRTVTIEKYTSVNVWVKLLKEWQDHLAKLVKTTMEAGVAERQIKVMEHTVALFSSALRGILKDLDIPWDDKTREVVRRHLMDVDIDPQEDNDIIRTA